MTVEYSQSNVDVRNDADLTGGPAILVTGDNVTLRNGGYLKGEEFGTIVRLTGARTTFINEAAGNVGSGFFRSTIIGSDHAETIINDGHIRGRVELGGGNDIYIERHSSAEVYFGDGEDHFDFVAGDDYIAMYNLSLRLYGGTGIDTLNLSGTGLKLSPIVRDFEVLNVSSALAYLNSFSGFQAINLAPGGFYELAYSRNPDVDLQLRSTLALRGSSSLHSIAGSDGQEELRISGNVRIGTDVDMGGGDDFVTIAYASDPGVPEFGGLVDGGAGRDTLEFRNDRGTAPVINLAGFRGFEDVRIQSSTSAVTIRGTSDATTLSSGASVSLMLSLQAEQLDVAAYDGSIELVAGSVVRSITGPGGHSSTPSDERLQVVNNGQILGDVRLGNGDDGYAGSGSLGGALYGFAGNDRLSGGRGSERIDGGLGDDVIRGGGGHDVVDGGEGVDTLVLEGAQAGYQTVMVGDRVVLLRGLDVVQAVGIEQVRFGGGTVRSWSDAIATTAGFDGLSYIASYGDLRQALGADSGRGLAHFVAAGFGERRGVTFDPLAYTASYADLRTTFGTDTTAAARHFILYGADEGRSVTFDPFAYLASYADLRAAYGIDTTAATRHYILWGAGEGRGTTFDAFGYLASNPRVLEALGADTAAAAAHYVTTGAAQGLSTSGFAALRYTASYGDLIAAFGTDTAAATRHYVQWGADEHRAVTFDPVAYGALYADLRTAYGIDQVALTRHYVLWGHAEGRSAGAPSNPTMALSDADGWIGSGAEADVLTAIQYEIGDAETLW